MRRFVVGALAAAGLALVGTGCGGSSSSGDGSASKGELTVVNYGGAIGDAMRTAWFEPFEKKTGIKVVEDAPTDYAKIQTQVDSDRVTWDVVELGPQFALSQCRKLFEPLDQDVDRSQMIPSFVTNDCGVPLVNTSVMIMYDKDKFGDDPPTSWADFFDTKKYPGKRSVWNFPAVNGALEGALLADGVPRDQLYPLDLDRAFKKLDTIKDDLVLTDDLAQMTEQLVSGSVAMQIAYTARAYEAVKQGAHYAPVWKDNLRVWDDFVILRGTKHRPEAEKFLNFVATPEAQAAFAKASGYGPTTVDTVPDVDELQASFLVTQPDIYKQGFNFDVKYWSENESDIISRWTDWATG